jgi:hypothetical protein
MFVRAIVIWFAILAVAFLNGGVREAWLIPLYGDTAGRAVSTAALCLAILAVCWFSIHWIGPVTRSDAIQVGAVWLVLTLAFEFLGGHYLFGDPWEQLLADYNLAAGRLWVFVLVTTFLAPLLVAGGRRSFPRAPETFRGGSGD